jgi:hypothetical protein
MSPLACSSCTLFRQPAEAYGHTSCTQRSCAPNRASWPAVMTFPHRAQHGAEVRERREQDREADRQDEEKRARQRPAAQASPSRSRISGRSVTLESTACPTFGEYEIGIARVIIAIFRSDMWR